MKIIAPRPCAVCGCLTQFLRADSYGNEYPVCSGACLWQKDDELRDRRRRMEEQEQQR